jgi:hypothetical protein
MTVEELYLKEKDRIEKLARHYARIFSSEAEDLFQEGALTVTEIYAKYGALPDEELFKVSHRVINRKIYKYAQNEYRYKTCPRNKCLPAQGKDCGAGSEPWTTTFQGRLDSGTTSSLKSYDATERNYS